MAFSNVSDTAFIVCCNRAAVSDFCGDSLAKEWIPESAWSLHQKYSNEVTPYDDLLIGLRFKFFHSELLEFHSKHPNSVLVNIASGFSSYSYLTQFSKIIEIDREYVINAKQELTANLLNKKTLPNERQVKYLSCDLASPDELMALKEKLKVEIGDRPVFFLLEGLIYYLKQEEGIRLFEMIASLQKHGDRIALSSWKPQTKNKIVFSRYLSFMFNVLGIANTSFTFHDPSFFKSLKGFELIKTVGFPELARISNCAMTFKEEDPEVFTEDLHVMERTAKNPC